MARVSLPLGRVNSWRHGINVVHIFLFDPATNTVRPSWSIVTFDSPAFAPHKLAFFYTALLHPVASSVVMRPVWSGRALGST